jgi:FkbH-like protein
MFNLKYSEILKRNRKFNTQSLSNPYQINVLSNITISQIKELLEFCLRSEQINACVQSGGYDNIVQDSGNCKNVNLVIIFWELANLVDGFYYKASTIKKNEIEELIKKLKAEIDFVIENLKDSSLILINKFTTLIFENDTIAANTLKCMRDELNDYLGEKVSPNVMLLDIDRVIAKASIQASVDWRNYYSSKALYTIEFFKHYSTYIKPIVLAANGIVKKVLIFDCDNTLWKGIIGEDGAEGIEMSSNTENGAIFAEIQHLALEFMEQGVILGLCSKNNLKDLDEILINHPDMILREKDIAIKRVNWKDKVSNLNSIAEELNLGLDSFVFVDDSDFEINHIREALPQVITLKVPENLYEYPKMLKDNAGLFFQISTSEEDRKKSEMYQEENSRNQQKIKFENFSDYLSSLGLKLRIFVDEKKHLSRISQLTIKTNQFNFTSKRYTEADIQKFFNDENFRLFAFKASDKFGDYGITGLSLVKLDIDNKFSEINTFLMSCRVMGRHLEYAFFDFIVNYLKTQGIKTMKVEYYETQKNKPVLEFCEKLNFRLIPSKDANKSFLINLHEYKNSNLSYIIIEES